MEAVKPVYPSDARGQVSFYTRLLNAHVLTPLTTDLLLELVPISLDCHSKIRHSLPSSISAGGCTYD